MEPNARQVVALQERFSAGDSIALRLRRILIYGHVEDKAYNEAAAAIGRALELSIKTQ